MGWMTAYENGEFDQFLSALRPSFDSQIIAPIRPPDLNHFNKPELTLKPASFSWHLVLLWKANQLIPSQKNAPRNIPLHAVPGGLQ